EDGIRDFHVTGVQTCALPIYVACGERITIKELWQLIREITGSSVDPVFRENREGDIPHSLADISKAKTLLGYHPEFGVKQGLQQIGRASCRESGSISGMAVSC